MNKKKSKKTIDSKKSGKSKDLNIELQETKDKYKAILDEGLRFIERAGDQIYFAIATYKTIQRAKKKSKY